MTASIARLFGSRPGLRVRPSGTPPPAGEGMIPIRRSSDPGTNGAGVVRDGRADGPGAKGDRDRPAMADMPPVRSPCGEADQGLRPVDPGEPRLARPLEAGRGHEADGRSGGVQGFAIDGPLAGETSGRDFSCVRVRIDVPTPAALKEGPILSEVPYAWAPPTSQAERPRYPVLECLKDKFGSREGVEGVIPEAFSPAYPSRYRRPTSSFDAHELRAPSQHELDVVADMVDMVIDRDLKQSLAFDSQPGVEFFRAGSATNTGTEICRELPTIGHPDLECND